MRFNMPIKRFSSALILFGLAVASLITTTITIARAQQAPAQGQTNASVAVNLTATSANVSQPGSPVRINVLRWSTDAERNQFVASMNPPAPAPAQAAGAAGDRGGAPRGGRGGAARGGRGDAAAAPPPFDPIVSLTGAIGKAPTLGYLWTNEVAGYSIRYAYRTSLPDGGERIILATDRRLGGFGAAWKPLAPTQTEYPFTIIEMRLNPRGQGEGKTTLTTKVIVDSGAGTLAVDNYAAAPAILAGVKR